MASYTNFQSDNQKYKDKNARLNKFNPDFNPAVNVNGNKENLLFLKNIDKWVYVVSFYR